MGNMEGIMSYIQCKDSSEVEKHLEKLKTGFVTEDNRIYSSIELSDDVCSYELDSETVTHLYDLQTNIEIMLDEMHEMSFVAIAKDAQLLVDSFKKALESIKFKPIVRK